MSNLTARLAVSIPIVTAVLVACSSQNPFSLGRPSDCPANVAPCQTDEECSDHIFCNGVERCAPNLTNVALDCRGCAPPLVRTPCGPTEICSESGQRCLSACDTRLADADGDGHRSAACGGDDCDDNDAQRFPGNPEVCDATDHDEDCDATTFGSRDADNDGYVDALCCNNGGFAYPSGVAVGRMCGNDCNDGNAAIHPNLPELCNGVDDNCNQQIDENVKVTLFVDADHDGYGAPNTGSPQCPNTPGYSIYGNDCDDTNAAIVPGAVVCSGAANTDTVNKCDPQTGLYVGDACLKGFICVPQPNGTGVCR